MRHLALAALAALVIAVVLVLVVAEDEVGEDTPTATATVTETNGGTVTDSVTLPTREGTPPRRETAKVERAVAAYVEAAERGEVHSPGLPTSDELSFGRTVVGRSRARVALVGGARLLLRKTDGRWLVVRAAVRTPAATPPSNGP